MLLSYGKYISKNISYADFLYTEILLMQVCKKNYELTEIASLVQQ